MLYDAWTSKELVILKPLSGPDDPKLRLPIETLMSDLNYKIQRDLFLQGFANVQRIKYNDPKSFYAVAGIHGLPYEPYNEDGEMTGGYCHHGDTLFPTWHRPYVSLLEMLIYDEASDIVKGYPDDREEKNIYQKGLEDVRFPYWDWASPSTLCQGMPSVLSEEYVTVTTLRDTGEEEIRIRNPLRAYTLPVNLGTMGSVGDTSNPTQRPYDPDACITPYTPSGYATVRHPNENYLSNMDSTNLEIVRSCSSKFRPSICDILLVEDWLYFSNHNNETNEDDKDYKHYSSIEGVHDSVHDAIGGLGGHMGYTDIAGFDPIFFLHHANVDRLVAIWQAIHPDHPDSWIIGDDKLAPLKPFLKTETEYWTSDDVRNIKNLGYTYPELKDPISPKELLKDMLNYYQPIPNSNIKWKLTITVKKNKVGSPFQVRAFIDLPTRSTDSSTPPITSPNFAGFVSIFARGSETNCEKCKSSQDAVVNGEIDLTACMQRLGIINKKNKKVYKPLPKPKNDQSRQPEYDPSRQSEYDPSLQHTPKDLNERITLMFVLKDNSRLSFKNVGFKSAGCWEIDYSENITNPNYNYLGGIVPDVIKKQPSLL
ncbi:6083_t:CDS:2 [Cetraspora pellucida]|uniref:6083_t:CDS:1 n=1 Tax=Cetraspora pellucida TaxID=1433469 RepID=A0ACA9JZ12_9GLOM|nr:6083_t:CDS:2 [Cetraspora pellucida]